MLSLFFLRKSSYLLKSQSLIMRLFEMVTLLSQSAEGTKMQLVPLIRLEDGFIYKLLKAFRNIQHEKALN